MKLKILCTLYFLALAVSTILSGDFGPFRKQPFHPAFEQWICRGTLPDTYELRFPDNTAPHPVAPRFREPGRRLTEQ